MLDNLKYADLIKLNNIIYMVKNKEKLNNNFYKITLKNMDSGKISEEFYNDDIVNKMNISLYNISYIKSDPYYHYYIDEETKKEIKYKITFIGTDFEYINKIKTKEFLKKVKPIECNINPNNIKKNTLVTFSCDTDNSKIYYTLDGSEPNESSILYNTPILITKNILIRAKAYKDGYESSLVSDFDFHIKSRKIKVFLSPSRQNNNVGCPSSGFTTEYIEMNKICDEIEKILSKYDCILYRNSYETFIEDWSIINHKENIDCHIAIHSNATSYHDKKGVENWIHDEYSDTYSLAKMIYDNIYKIYYDNSNVITNRGVKYAKGALAEASPAYFKFSMNLEIAYHDNYEDACWIVNNRVQIAQAISKAIIEYYQLELKNNLYF